MKSLKQWRECQANKSPDPDELDAKMVKPEEKNAHGGIDPKGEAEVRKFKHADLITLPPGVGGTNCGNCKYAESVGNGVLFCKHHDIQTYVSKKMCCVYWDNDKVVRQWKKDD